jgi:RND family efflux transporter MFP subunit
VQLLRSLCLVLLALDACADKGPPKAPPPREVDVIALKKTTVRDTADYLGSLLSRQSVNVLPQVAGYVRRIDVKPGDTVKAGAVLVELDARQETAALESVQAARTSSKAGLELAQQTLQRTKALYEEGLVSAQELERAEASAQAAVASQQQATAQVSQRQVQLNYYAVRAPFDGVVGDVVVRLGDYVSGTTTLTSIAQGDVLEVTVSVPPERARQVTRETPIELLYDDGRVRLATKVYFIAPQADPKTQLVDLKGNFRNTVGLLPSELVRVRVVYGERQALIVPALAITRQSGQAFVYVAQAKDDGLVASKKPVTLGPLGESGYVVEGGVGEGERVITSSIQALREGMRVTPKAAASAQAKP